MQKVFCWILVLSFFYSCSGIKKNKNEFDRTDIIKFHISKIIEFASFYHLEIPEPEKINHIDSFDNEGFKKKAIAFGENGKPERIMMYSYLQDDLISIEGFSPDSGFIFKEVRNYNEKHQRQDLYFYQPDGSYKYRNSATFDPEGNMVELKWYWTTGLSAVNKYVYEKGNMVRNTEFGPEGNLRYQWNFTYDENNHLIESVQFSPEGKTISKIANRYNVDGLLVEQINYFGESVQNIYTYKYNNKKLLVEKILYSGTKKISASFRYEYEYY